MCYKQIISSLQTDKNKRAVAMTVRLVASNFKGSVYFTDLFLQTGTTSTGWLGHVSEIKWVLNG